ncbi:MAG: hypothetical protein WCP01_04915 [Methylococcaceae bacterium]
MNEEFLVEPAGFNSALELKYVLEKFGFFQGRFIGQFPKGWKKQIYENMGKLPDLEQARIRNLLEKNQDCLVPLGQIFDSTSPWLKNAHQQVEQQNFVGIIAANANQWNYPTAEDMDQDYLKGGHDIRILASSNNYTKITRRLLQLSHEIVLVDPYLKLDRNGCEQVLNNFLTIAQQGKCRSLVIWARHEKACMSTETAYLRMLKEKYQGKLKEGSQIIVKLVNDHDSSQKMHARLMLSTLGGFRFDHGFSEFDEDRYVDVAIIDKKTHDHYCRWYLDPGSPNDFKIVEEHVI